MEPASTALKPKINASLVIASVAFCAVLFYILMSANTFRVGFPLDDAWIHQTYARNLAEHGEWAFRLGQPSAGSTSPIWTVLLSIGYFLHLAPYAWTFFLGWLVLTCLGISAEQGARKIASGYQPSFPWVGIYFVMAWHLTWSAVSGMETLLHGLLAFLILSSLVAGSRKYLALGLLSGLSVWIRPDGVTLLGPILFFAWFVEPDWSARKNGIVKTLLGFGALFLPFLVFNLALSGNPMPNTFYAKQAEYESYWLARPFLGRLLEYLLPVLASPSLVLVPGIFIFIVKAVRARNWGAIAGLVWFIGYVAMYFMRLPAYQHGRYIIPALPILYLFGIVGFLEYVSSPRAVSLIVFVWQTLLAVLLIFYTSVAARQNALDIYWIESEMVETAKWVQSNIPPDKLLAVHDIGALGYYVPNPIVDLAGLITPDVVPIIRDESRLRKYLVETSSDYLIVFRSDYPNLTADLKPVFTAGRESGPIQFDNNINIYRLR